MKIYLVGGAVRDQLLGRPVKERDYVVVGATPEQMLAQGFRPVGKDFPVFLHPQSHEEYALARTERKVGKGYTGFEFYAAPEVTLEEDLQRRDLTINAIAQDTDGKLIDPYGGQRDLEQKILRHVSLAFAEDPVRILRLARFAARFDEFKIDPQTMQLMRQMVQAGEVDALVAERVWQELEIALEEKSPQRFFEVLQECNALEKLFPEITENSQAISALQNAARISSDGSVRFAAMFYHSMPEAVKKLCDRYRVPTEYRDLAILVSRYHENFETAKTPNAEALLITLSVCDAFRRLDRFEKFLLACEANNLSDAKKISQIFKKAYQAAAQVSVQPLIDKGLTGKDIAEELFQLRVAAIEKIVFD